MAKFLKSIFSTEKRRPSRTEATAADEAPPLDDRRKLSISRSGRMRQANKHRRSLTPQLYGDENFQAVEKSTSKEYHVNKPIHPVELPKLDTRRQSADSQSRKQSHVKTPEEEIDSAFEIIDKS